MIERNRNQWLAALLSAFAVGVVMLRFFDPATSGMFPPCPVHYLTGWYCPGCGSLRAIHQLLHGNLRAAWVALVVLTAFATGACAVGFFNASHGAAGSAVAAAAAGFAALLIDTAKLTEPLSALAASATILIARQPGSNNDEPQASPHGNEAK